MIYLIKSHGGDISKGEHYYILKIGYTSEESRKSRFDQYYLHNPYCEILYEIPNLTEDDEKRVQYHFRNYRLRDRGREWFHYSEPILDFFKNIQDYDIASLPKSPMSEGRDHRRMWRYVRNSMYFIPEIPSDVKEDYAKKIFDELGSNLSGWKDLVPFILRDYGDVAAKNFTEIKEREDSGIYSEDHGINGEVQEFFREYEKISLFRDRLKFLCEYGLSDIGLKIVLDQIGDHDNIKSFYLALGPSCLKSLGYDKYHIKKD